MRQLEVHYGQKDDRQVGFKQSQNDNFVLLQDHDALSHNTEVRTFKFIII